MRRRGECQHATCRRLEKAERRRTISGRGKRFADLPARLLLVCVVGARDSEERACGEAFRVELDGVIGLPLCGMCQYKHANGAQDGMLSPTLMSILCSFMLSVSGPS